MIKKKKKRRNKKKKRSEQKKRWKKALLGKVKIVNKSCLSYIVVLIADADEGQVITFVLLNRNIYSN